MLVEVAAVGVCGSDVHYYEHGRIGPNVVERPLVLGHEASGRVVGLGAQAGRHAVGQLVAIEPGVPCGRCAQCRAGRYNLCPDVRFFGTPPIDGAFARYVTIHEDFAPALPDHVSDEAGALVEPLSVGIWACRKAAVAPASPAGRGPWPTRVVVGRRPRKMSLRLSKVEVRGLPGWLSGLARCG